MVTEFSQRPGPLSQGKRGWGAVSWGTSLLARELGGWAPPLGPKEGTHGFFAPSASRPWGPPNGFEDVMENLLNDWLLPLRLG